MYTYRDIETEEARGLYPDLGHPRFYNFSIRITFFCHTNHAGTSGLVLSMFLLSFSLLLRNNLEMPISVYSCYTPELLCGSSSSWCTLIVYRDGRSAKEKGK